MTARTILFALFLAGAAGAAQAQPAPIDSLNSAERELVLDRMRLMLANSHTILDAALRNDLPRVAQSARALGLSGGAHMPPEITSRLPAPFRELAQQTHRGFDDIAAEAERGAPRDAVLERLSANLGRCVACHAAYRFSPR